MMPQSARNRRRDSRRRYKGYPYANKKWVRKQAARAARHAGATTNEEYKKAYDVWWTIW